SIKYDFTGRVALITGSSAGIGAATAILLAKSGAQVVITGRNANNIDKVCKQCTEVSPKGLKAVSVVADVTKEADLDRLLATTVQTCGQLDILVNNVGFTPMCPFTDEHFMQNFRSVMDTNLNSIVYLTKISVEYLEKTNGSVINMSSVLGLITAPLMTSYCMSKVALDMFTKCMAVELGPKRIRVNSINAGLVGNTNFFKTNFGATDAQESAMAEHMEGLLPVGRLGDSLDVANAVAYLASNEGSFVTGTNLLIDGGHMAANVGHNIGFL
ncbi:unnamed protein product, partial [Medioppia subpectinata]